MGQRGEGFIFEKGAAITIFIGAVML